MLKYDLTDLGYQYKGAATVPSKKMEIGPWNIIDIPKDISNQIVEKEIKGFLNKICAIEIPTSLECNLRCKYCYVDDPRMKNKKVLKDDVTKALEGSTQMFPGLMKNNPNRSEKVNLTSWGAEPFVNINTLEAMYEFGHEYYGKDGYVLGLSTNGTIWTKRIEQLFINLLNDNALNDIQISLDGPPEIQNKNRPFVNGKPSFESVKKFTLNFIDLMVDLKVKNQKHHFCSTIHLQDDNFANEWIASAEFFSEPNQWHTALPYLPMRMSGEDMYGEEEINRFVEAQKRMLDLTIKRSKEGIVMADFYVNKLFGNTSCKSYNANPYCSAMNTQIGIDIDGSLYPCHGAITTPTYKPWLWFGNLFDKTISYSKFIRNIHYQYNNWNRGKCVDCEIYHYTTGSVCWSCAPHNLAVSGEPTIDNIMKCKAYNESFPYWVKMAKINFENPVLDEMDVTVEVESKNKMNFNGGLTDMHYDRNFDGIIHNSVQKICDKNINIDDMYYSDSWWKFDNFYDECEGE